MKLVILAGGYGTRMSETTNLIPKPMAEIGGRPMLWHIMKIYSQFGINEFIICCGYKQYVIKEYFANYFRHNSDLTVDLSDNSMKIHNNNSENWKVTIVDTGLNTMTGGRVKRIQDYVGNETFCLTYGDGLGDINIAKTIENHKRAGKVLSMTTYQPSGKLGVLDISEDGIVKSFMEKPENSGSWINAGFFVCEPKLFEYLKDDNEMFEREPMDRLIAKKQVNTFKHNGFWMPMDTLRDNQILNKMWNDNKADWKVW
jgi:glucose-1-phosphate cytidylyltransferase